MRRRVLAVLTVSIALGAGPASAQANPLELDPSCFDVRSLALEHVVATFEAIPTAPPAPDDVTTGPDAVTWWHAIGALVGDLGNVVGDVLDDVLEDPGFIGEAATGIAGCVDTDAVVRAVAAAGGGGSAMVECVVSVFGSTELTEVFIASELLGIGVDQMTRETLVAVGLTDRLPEILGGCEDEVVAASTSVATSTSTTMPDPAGDLIEELFIRSGVGVPAGWTSITSYCWLNPPTFNDAAAQVRERYLVGWESGEAILIDTPPYVVTTDAEMFDYVSFVAQFCAPGHPSTESYVRTHIVDRIGALLAGGPLAPEERTCTVSKGVDTTEELERTASRLLAGGTLETEVGGLDLDEALDCIDMAGLYSPAFVQAGLGEAAAVCVAEALVGSVFYREALATALAGGTPGFAATSEIEAAARTCGVDLETLAPPEPDE